MLEIFHTVYPLNSELESSTKKNHQFFSWSHARILPRLFLKSGSNLPQIMSIEFIVNFWHKLFHLKVYLISSQILCPKIMFDVSHKFFRLRLCLKFPRNYSPKFMPAISHKLFPPKSCLKSPTIYFPRRYAR